MSKILLVFGFGGILPGQQHVTHCFPLNFNPADPGIVPLIFLLIPPTPLPVSHLLSLYATHT